MTAQRRQLLYAGTYERDYPRNALTIEALDRAGFDLREVHAAVWERDRDKSGRFLRPASLLRLGARLVAAYASVGTRLALMLPTSDAVVIGYIGQADMLVLGSLAKLAGRPVVFNPLVTLTDTRVEDRRLVRRDGPLAKAVAVVDRLALRLADAIVVDTPENGEYLRQRFGIPVCRIYQIDVGADELLFRPDVCPAPAGGPVDWAGGDLRVLFYGKFTPLHGIDTILHAAKQLEGHSEIRFEIIGSGQLRGEMEALARRLELRAVDFIPWVPFERLPECIAAADVFLGIFGDTDKARRVIPNKVFQGMAMGAAIVTRDSPAIGRVLNNGRSALLVPPANSAALASAILRLRDPALRAELGRSARLGFEATASLDSQAERLAAVIEAVTRSRHRAAAAGSWR